MTNVTKITTSNLPELFRTTVGYDHLMRTLDSFSRPAPNYPPYDIVGLDDDNYEIRLAVAGCTSEELTVQQDKNMVEISFNPAQPDDSEKPKEVSLYRGIARRAFTREFALAEHVNVTGVELENGILTVKLVREVPESEKPKTFKVSKTK